MNERSHDDFAHERQALDALHAQNEAQRDGFIGLAHTALFAASVSFVGGVTPLATAVWRPMLIVGWSASVIGLLALTFSFNAATRSINARRAALLDANPPTSRLPEVLNAIALWSFPVALLCLFSFVTANVVHADDQRPKPTVVRRLRAEGVGAAVASPDTRRTIRTLDGHCPGTKGTDRAPACGTASQTIQRLSPAS